jgi:hypothetical protein
MSEMSVSQAPATRGLLAGPSQRPCYEGLDFPLTGPKGRPRVNSVYEGPTYRSVGCWGTPCRRLPIDRSVPQGPPCELDRAIG